MTVMGGPLLPLSDPTVMVQTITAGSTTSGVAPFMKQKKKKGSARHCRPLCSAPSSPCSMPPLLPALGRRGMAPWQGEDVGVTEVGIDGSESKASGLGTEQSGEEDGSMGGEERRGCRKGRNKEMWGKMPTGDGVAGGREKEWMGEK